MFFYPLSAFAFTGGCSDNKIDYNNNIYFFMLQLDRGEAKSLPWVYSADHGNLDECKEFMRLGGGWIKKYMKGSKGWVGWGIVHRKIINKDEFCNSNGPYSTFGLGVTALRFCSRESFGGINVQNLSDHELCLSALSPSGSDWSSLDLYVDEVFDRDLELEDCREYKFEKSEDTSFLRNYTPTTMQNFENSSFQFDEKSNEFSSQIIEEGNDNLIASRLEKLKNLLDKGLISQEQYDIKSSEILESF